MVQDTWMALMDAGRTARGWTVGDEARGWTVGDEGLGSVGHGWSLMRTLHPDHIVPQPTPSISFALTRTPQTDHCKVTVIVRDEGCTLAPPCLPVCCPPKLFSLYPPAPSRLGPLES